MKTMIKNVPAYVTLLFMVITFSCKKDDLVVDSSKGNGGSAELKSLLVGPSSKMWELADAQNADYWDRPLGPWKHYTFIGGKPFLLSPCVLKNDHKAFYADGTFASSIYKCDIAETQGGTDASNGGTGMWQLAADNVTLTLGGATFRLESVNATDLYISNYSGTFHYVSVDSQPFLTRNQQISGSFSKTWKYINLNYNYEPLPLTAAQESTLLTYKADGTLISSFTDVSFGQPVDGSWALVQTSSYASSDLQDYALINTMPSSSNLLLKNLNANILELTPTSIVVQYRDTILNNTIIYMVSQ